VIAGCLLAMRLLVFLRTHLADADRARLLAKSESSSKESAAAAGPVGAIEKLVSLGKLAAGAAHEINIH